MTPIPPIPKCVCGSDCITPLPLCPEHWFSSPHHLRHAAQFGSRFSRKVARMLIRDDAEARLRKQPVNKVNPVNKVPIPQDDIPW